MFIYSTRLPFHWEKLSHYYKEEMYAVRETKEPQSQVIIKKKSRFRNWLKYLLNALLSKWEKWHGYVKNNFSIAIISKLWNVITIEMLGYLPLHYNAVTALIQKLFWFYTFSQHKLDKMTNFFDDKTQICFVFKLNSWIKAYALQTYFNSSNFPANLQDFENDFFLENLNTTDI